MAKRSRMIIKSITQDNIVMTVANRNCSENLLDLTDLIEQSDIQADGTVAFVKRIKLFLRTTSTNGSVQPYVLLPVIVQTAGTFSDSMDQSDRIIDLNLDAAIDDEFGYQKITDPKCSSIINVTDDGGLEYHHHNDFNLEVPRNIINLLNKEQSTERLQSIIFGLVGSSVNAAQSVVLNLFYLIEYELRAKGITIR